MLVFLKINNSFNINSLNFVFKTKLIKIKKINNNNNYLLFKVVIKNKIHHNRHHFKIFLKNKKKLMK